MSQVFISYASQDRDRVLPIADELIPQAFQSGLTGTASKVARVGRQKSCLQSRPARLLVSFRQRCVMMVQFGLLLAGLTLRKSLSHF
jgi:hypothetical protein